MTGVRVHLRSVALWLLLVVVAGPAWATQHLVRAGDDWSRLGDRVKPGDEIVLFPGRHRAARFDDIAGEPGRPIVIRSADRRAPITIEGEDVGLELRGVRHVRVEGIAIVDVRRAGVLIVGTEERPAEGIELRNLFVTRVGDRAERAGVRVESASSITLRELRVDGWHGAAVHLSDARDVRIERCQFVGMPTMPDAHGILIDGRSRGIAIERCRFQAGVESMVSLGLAAPEGGGADDARDHLAFEVVFERCLGDRVGRLATIGSCRDVQVRANTLSEVEIGYEIVAPPRGWNRPRNVLIQSNLVTWTPGTLRRFSSAAPDVDPTGVFVEANLWWSVELPAAKELLGGFAGTVKSQQVLDVDPKLDGTLRPRAAAAAGFGTESP
jgi:hypothetical protein